jgi:hypothetical protein
VTAGSGQRPSGHARRALGAAAAVALVGIYLGVAAVAHLAPWHKAAAEGSAAASGSSPPGHEAPAAAPDSSPDTSPDTSPDSSSGQGSSASPAAQALRDLIPAGVRAAGCPTGKLLLGAIAVRNCSGVSYGPGKTGALISYYLFADNATLDRAYAAFLNAANVAQGAGNCGDFRSFRPPCETAIRNATPAMTGRAVEYTHGGFADIVSSDEQRHVLVWVTAKDGKAMLTWWLNPRRWLVAG